MYPLADLHEEEECDFDEPLVVRMFRETVDLYRENKFLRGRVAFLEKHNKVISDGLSASIQRGDDNMWNFILALVTKGDTLDRLKAVTKKE